MGHVSELASNRARIVVHGLLTIAALFIGAGAIVLMRGGDDSVTATHEEVVVPNVAPAKPKTLPPITLPNIDVAKPNRVMATR